jgi:hypothetical protein
MSTLLVHTPARLAGSAVSGRASVIVIIAT